MQALWSLEHLRYKSVIIVYCLVYCRMWLRIVPKPASWRSNTTAIPKF